MATIFAKKFQVGQTVYVTPTQYRSRYVINTEQLLDLQSRRVTKVGRKWVYVGDEKDDELFWDKYSLETGWHSDVNNTSRIYADPNDYWDEVDCARALVALKKALEGNQVHQFSLDQLNKAICDLGLPWYTACVRTCNRNKKGK